MNVADEDQRAFVDGGLPAAEILFDTTDPSYLGGPLVVMTWRDDGGAKDSLRPLSSRGNRLLHALREAGDGSGRWGVILSGGNVDPAVLSEVVQRVKQEGDRCRVGP